jgi:hypothetical protein
MSDENIKDLSSDQLKTRAKRFVCQMIDLQRFSSGRDPSDVVRYAEPILREFASRRERDAGDFIRSLAREPHGVPSFSSLCEVLLKELTPPPQSAAVFRPGRSAEPEGGSKTANRCHKCGKEGSSGGNSGQIVIAKPERFEDMVGKCQDCGTFVCGACADKVDMVAGVLYKCPKCGGSIGPA